MVRTAAARGDGTLAARIAVLLGERDLAGDDIDLRERLEALGRLKSDRGRAALGLAESWLHLTGADPGPIDLSRTGAVLALAFPDRIAKARTGRAGEFLLANGRGATLDAVHPLARARYLAVAELAGDAARQRILLAAPLDEAELERMVADRIEKVEEVMFDPAHRTVRARRTRRLGALVLSHSDLADADPALTARALIDGIRSLGLASLPWSSGAIGLRARIAFLRVTEGDAWPDLSDETLSASLEDWLGPFILGRRSLAALAPALIDAAIDALLPRALRQRLESEAPTHVTAPSGARLPIDYAAPSGPTIAAKVQDLFGLSTHPMIAGGKIPLVIELLSPARRPVQVTRDLPGFWSGSYQAVRAAMRGRYPKHAWPEDPRLAPPGRKR